MMIFKKKYLRKRLVDLNNTEVTLECGKDTHIDEGVIVDSPELISIGSNTIIRRGVVLRPETGEIRIGDNCVVNHYCVFHGKGGIHVGDWSVIGPHCGFYAQNHTYDRFDVPITKQDNVGKGIYLMGDNWLGGHAVICDDVTLGKGTVIGANSTVLVSVPMGSVAVGNPARIVKKRHTGTWDFNRVERASRESPDGILEYVSRRGHALSDLIDFRDRVLEVGCGEGIITGILKQKTSWLCACDYSLEAIDIAKKQNAGVQLSYSNCTHLRFESGTFTKVILSDVAEHLLPRQFIQALREISRVLTADGILVLTTPLTGKAKRTSTYSHTYEYSDKEMVVILSNFFRKVELLSKEYGLFYAAK